MWQLLVLFVVASVLGFVLENHVLGFDDKRDRLLRSLGVPDQLNVFLTMYGVGAVLLYAINTVLSKYSVVLRIAICTMVLALFECGAGHASQRLAGSRGWDYRDETCHCCTGYVGLNMTLLFLSVSTVFCVLFDVIYPKIQ